MWSCVFLRMELAMVGSASEMAEVLSLLQIGDSADMLKKLNDQWLSRFEQWGLLHRAQCVLSVE